MTRINTNLGSLVATDNLQRTSTGLTKSIIRLSTGLKINSAADDAAGMIAAQFLQNDITDLQSAATHAAWNDSLLNTADSALSQMGDILSEVNGLVTASANTAVLSDEEIAANQIVVDNAVRSIDRISASTKFAGNALLDGSFSVSSSLDGQVALEIPAVNSNTLGEADADGTVTTMSLASIASDGANSLSSGNAANAADVIREAAAQIGALRASMGAFQKSELAATNSAEMENLQAARSQIVDTDFAAETAKLTRQQILLQAGTSVLSIANSKPQSVLSLLGG